MYKKIKFTGYVKSPKDKRDFRLSQVMGEPVQIPEVFMPDYSMLPMYHQHKQPSCIGHATTWMVNYFEYLEKDSVIPLSPRFIYALAKRDDGIPNQDGTYYRMGLKKAQDYGVCKESLFPNDADLDRETYNNASLIHSIAYEDAEPRKIRSYLNVDSLKFENLKQVIFQNKMVMLALIVDENMYTKSNGAISWLEKDILPLRLPKSRDSGHAVVAIGYDKDHIYFQNSWGDTWGRKGIGYFTKEYVPFLEEAWTVMDLPNDKIEELRKANLTLIELLKQYVEYLKNEITKKTMGFLSR